MVIIARKIDWVRYADAIGDYNPVHRDDAYARSKGLEGAIAPGMWLASHVQGKHAINGVGPIKFRKPVYDGTQLNIEKNRGESRLLAYNISSEGGLHCSVMNVKRRRRDGLVLDPRESLFVYVTEVTAERVSEFLKSLKRDGLLSGHLPEMFYASLAASALLAFGEKQGKTGLHGTQSFYSLKPAELGQVKINVKKGKRPGRGGVETSELEWMQNGELLGKGSASFLPLAA